MILKMNNLGEIKSHISAIGQTRQITNAMYLISASKMRSTIKKIDYNVKYMERLRSTMKDLLLHTDDLSGYPYIRHSKDIKNTLVIVITGDKGMCGGYNNNVISLALEKFAQCNNHGLKVGVIGIVGEEYFINHGIKPDFIWRGVIQNPILYNARQIAARIIEEYNSGNVDDVHVVYTRYKNSVVQTAEALRILPIEIGDYDDVSIEYQYNAAMNFEPSPGSVFSRLVPQYLIALIFNMLVQSSTSEYAARMNSMQTSTSNADDMLDSLRFEYNRRRQLDITSEIAEIAATSITVSGNADD